MVVWKGVDFGSSQISLFPYVQGRRALSRSKAVLDIIQKLKKTKINQPTISSLRL
jgi:hypothetical protein